MQGQLEAHQVQAAPSLEGSAGHPKPVRKWLIQAQSSASPSICRWLMGFLGLMPSFNLLMTRDEQTMRMRAWSARHLSLLMTPDQQTLCTRAY